MSELYKIGDFAKQLGVSPGFLKHHEKYGLLKPVVAENSYRFYEYNQGMLVFQCLKLQKFGFGSKEIADILMESDKFELLPALRQKKSELEKKLLYYDCVQEYLNQMIENLESCEQQDSWKIDYADPYYYMENSIIGGFDNNPKRQEVAERWNEYMPLIETFSRLAIPAGADTDVSNVRNWRKGICIPQKIGDSLNIYRNEAVEVFEKKRCLIYTSNTIREPKIECFIQLVLGKALALCQEHHFDVAGDIFTVQHFCSTAQKENRVNELVMIPIL